MMKKIFLSLLAFSLILFSTACSTIDNLNQLLTKRSTNSSTEDTAADSSEKQENNLTEALNKITGSSVLNPLSLTIDETIARQKKLAADSYDAIVYIDENDICYCYGTDEYSDGSNTDLQNKLIALHERGETAVQVHLGYSSLAAVLGSGGTVLFHDHEFFPDDNIRFFLYAGGDIYGVTSEGNVIYASVGDPETIYHAEGLSNVKSLNAYGGGILVAIHNDGTVSLYQQTQTPIKVASDWSSCDTSGWTDIAWAVPSVYYNKEAAEERTFIVGLKQDKTIVTAGDCPHEFRSWENIVFVQDIGEGQLCGLRSDGTLISTEDSEKDNAEYLTWTGLQAYKVSLGTSPFGVGAGRKLYGKNADKLEYGFQPDGTITASDFTVINPR